MLWNTLFALSILGVVRFGEYITEECPLRNYACPTACDVDHKHYPREECNGKSKEESRPDSTVVQSVQQSHKKAVGTDKPEGL